MASSSKKSHPAQQASAARGSLSARQWQDLRQAARLARSEGVTLVMHGVKVSGEKTTTARQEAPRQQAAAQRDAAQGAGDAQPMDTTAGAPAAVSDNSQQRRDARRLKEFLERKRAERWLPLVKSLLRAAHRNTLDATWTA